MTRFIQIHSLASYPAVLLNRDDAGLAKRLPYGGVSRIRVSSQCLKRHWRKPVQDESRIKEEEWALQNIGADMAVRSREIPERRIRPALDQADAGSPEIRDAVTSAFARLLYNPKQKTAPARKDRQALLIGDPEVSYLTKKAIEIARVSASPDAAVKAIDDWFKRGERNNLAAMLDSRRGALEAGLESALFGRMVTSDPEANTDAAIHVAHAFTVHKEECETDYFTVVDDLTREAGEAGSAGIFDTELTSGVFYGYVVVDVPLLVDNLGEDRDLAAKVVEHLIHLIATVSPGAKKGSTAPYGYAELMLVEHGRRQPRSLAAAFRKPVTAGHDGDLGAAAVRALDLELRQIDEAYGTGEVRSHLRKYEADAGSFGERRPLDGLAAFAADAVRQAA